MILHRDVFLNPVDPQYLALRVPEGVDTKVNLHIKSPQGVPLAQDTVAQLQLVSRSRNTTTYLSCPSIDTVNGVARVTIPADFPSDPNGWNLRLTGTVDAEPRVMGYGVMTQIAGAGPQVEPQDIIDQVDLVLTRGQIAQVGVKLWDDAGGSDPFDLADEGTTVTSSVYVARGGAVLVPFTVTVVASNEVLLTLTAAQVDALPDLCWWSLVASNASGANTLCEGSVTVRDAP
jgi:hypothetical protein